MSDILEVMRGHLPDEQADEAAYPPAFARIAELLLDKSVLHVAGIPHRFTEIEFYYKGRKHVDKFTHGDPFQKRFGSWYFHRTGGEYRGGTYKGLDIAFGSEDAPAGILIRGVERMDGEPVLVDGPCLVVDHMLALTGASAIPDLVARFDLSVAPPGGDVAKSPLCVTVREAPLNKPIYRCPRVGLTLKRADTPDRRSFITRDYRFLNEPTLIKKGKHNLVVALHRQGLSEARIAAITSTSLSVVRRYIESYTQGRGKDAALFKDAANTADTCALFGACDGPVG